MAGRHSLPARRPQLDWNPMNEDYYDPNFNSYNFGPGSRMDFNLQPWNPRREEKRVYKLYIQNIPAFLEECGLGYYFTNCHAAAPVDVYVNPPAPGSSVTWGFAYYERQSDAEFAIRAVTGKPPLHLKVQFARSDEEKSRLRNVVEEEDRWKTSLVSSPYVPVDNKDQYIQRLNGLGRGHRFSSHSGQHRPAYYFESDGEYYGYYDDEDVGFDGYRTVKEDSSVRMSRQALQCPELKIECDGGQRRVSMGRGYFRSDQVDGSDGTKTPPVNQQGVHPSEKVIPHTTVLSLTERTVHLRQENYEFGTLPEFEEGPCGSCKRYTTKHCGYCSQWYCSRECQRLDWEVHQPLCHRMPPLEDSRTKTDISRRPALPNGDPKMEPAFNPRVTNGIPSANSRVDGIAQASFPVEVNKLISKTEGVSLNDSENITEEPRRGKDGLLGEFPGTSENDGSSGDFRGRKEKCGLLGDHPRQVEFSGNDPQHDRRNNNLRHRRQDNENPNPKRNQGNRTKSGDRFGGGRHDRRIGNNNNNNKQRNDQEEKKDGEQVNGQRMRGNEDLHDGRRSLNHGLRNEFRRDAFKNEGQRRNTTGQKSYSSDHSRERIDGRNSGNDHLKNDRLEPVRNVANCESRLNSHSFDDSNKLHQSEMSCTGNELQVKPLNRGELQETKTSKFASSTGAIPKSRSRLSSGVVQDSNYSSNASAEKTTEDLPEGAYTEVKVVLAEGPLDYWVQLKSREQDVLDLLRELLPLGEDSPVADLKVGGLCACRFEGIWYRTRILTVSPDLKVHYVDYGNTEVVQDSNALKCLPPQALKLPDQAIRIQLATGTSDKWKNLAEETTLFVKPSKVVGNLNVVHVQGETYDEHPTVAEITVSDVTLQNNCDIEPVDDRDIQTKTTAGAEDLIRNDGKLLNSSVSLLQCGICGYLQYKVPLGPFKFVATILCEEFADSFKKVMVDVSHHAPTAKPLDDPQPRDLVMAKTEKIQKGEGDSWLRAYVISAQDKSYLVAFCDTGELELVSEVKQLGSEYRTVCGMAVQCTVTDTILKPEAKVKELLKVSENFKFEVLSTTETSALIFLKVKDGEKPFCKAKLSPWLPPFKHNLKCVQLKDGPFSLSTFYTPKDVFVRPSDKNSSSLFARLLQDLNGFCHKVPSLDQMPSIGDLVAGKYSGDGNYYRALVRNIEENDIKVSYVDFGNCEVLHLDNLKPITDELKSYPCFALKVTLKDVVDQPLNKEVADYFGEIVRKDLELKLKVADSQSKLVELHLPDGTSLNEKANTLLKPSWEKSDPSRLMEEDIYIYNDMAIVELPVREVKLGIQQILTCNQIAAVNMEDPVLIENVHLTMAATMNTYCNETDQKSYVPRQGEACLASYQGEWFRAVCVGTGQGLLSVMFIDYGNFSEVPHTDIRKMVKEFYETPALTCLCKIKGIDEQSQNKEKIKERLLSLMPQDSVLSIKVVGKTEDQLHYEIEVPQVISTLANEGLL